jgi:sortase (surface protein transpeptidase)
MKNEWSLKSYNESVLFEEALEKRKHKNQKLEDESLEIGKEEKDVNEDEEKGKLEGVQVEDASLEIPAYEKEKDDNCGYNCENCASRH